MGYPHASAVQIFHGSAYRTLYEFGISNVPIHFGYDISLPINKVFPNTYLTVTKGFTYVSNLLTKSNNMYSVPYMGIPGFNEDDFKMLSNDSKIIKIYSSNEVDFYHIA